MKTQSESNSHKQYWENEFPGYSKLKEELARSPQLKAFIKNLSIELLEPSCNLLEAMECICSLAGDI